MAQPDFDIPVPEKADSLRARLQALAERVGVLAPGAPLTDELVAFAEGAIDMARDGRQRLTADRAA
ncbi:hypothetical protein J2W32_001891 [Variovorax boronicumulans]|jgi:hypothetical protein|uniref:Aminoglycoside phosphotransferase n=1 Tax=Variovorax boronicumulans TaxID=436515 RepID=A0AAW8CVD2_9BURK|nr:aminoglycoside phosphotransferase [Variovorax boronicumulans]MDP9891672.1 hypothetical protein [Variovorax boronicumulans]MDP9991635.1 hypothetical protein [Variovorax boronicumulans]MDQ0003663.1 hypothetical protein [Variovorax boronicumulans]MDQ0040755.1 hypothetical protein [Variovorax boronicumulans]MDQ0052845.1 hypothetical protein [Variovorax boronicumulans]